MTAFSDPWGWRPSVAVWYRKLGEAAEKWFPAPVLRLEREAIVRSVLLGASHAEPWLYHPCVNALTLGGNTQPHARDLQFAAWVAAHVELPPTMLTVETPAWLWSPSGGVSLPPGTYDIVALGKQISDDPWPWKIAVDTWCDSTGLLAEHSWASLRLETGEQPPDLPGLISSFLQALDLAAQYIPDCFDWVCNVIKVAVPLCGTVSHTRSTSYEKLPGIVDLTFGDRLYVLEALVHEAAHQHLFLLRNGAPLTDPKDRTTYPSPLRKDPRPLGAVLTAYHAVVYMILLYTRLGRIGLLSDRRGEHRLKTLQAQLVECEHTLVSYKDRLTPLGQSVLDTTMELAPRAELAENARC